MRKVGLSVRDISQRVGHGHSVSVITSCCSRWFESLHTKYIGASGNIVSNNPTCRKKKNTGAIKRQFFDRIQVILQSWFSRSPVIPPIEHVWDIIGVNIANLQRLPNTLVV
jgi:hypothetical protein